MHDCVTCTIYSGCTGYTLLIQSLWYDYCYIFSLGSDLTLADLKREFRPTNEQLDAKVGDCDLPELAACFGNTEDYVEKLGLTPGQQTDVRTQAFVHGTQTGVKLALKYWKKGNSHKVTYRDLLLILLSLKKGNVAVCVCKYLIYKSKSVHGLISWCI